MASIVDLTPPNLNPVQTGIGIAGGLGNLWQQGMQNQLMNQTLPSTIGARNAQNQLVTQTMPSTIDARNAQNNATALTSMPLAQTALAKAQLYQKFPMLQVNPQIGAIQYLMAQQGQQGQQQGANLGASMPNMSNLQAIDPSQPQQMLPQQPQAQPLQNNSLANAFNIPTLPNGQPDFGNLAMNMLTADYRQKMAMTNYYTGLGNTIDLRHAPALTKEQNMATLQGLGYPAAVSMVVAADPITSQYITQHQVPYTEYLKGGIPHVSPFVNSGQVGGAALTSQPLNNPQLSPSTQPATGAPMAANTSAAPQVQIPMAAPVANNQPAPPAQAAPTVQDAQAAQVAAQAQQQGGETQSSIFKATTTKDQQVRLAAATRAIPALQQMYDLAPQALQFAGKYGAGKKVFDAVANPNDPGYVAYQKYKQAQAIAEPDTALGTGVHETDAGFQQFKPLFDIDNLSTTPESAQSLLKNAMQLIENESKTNTQNMAQQQQYINSNPVGQILSKPPAGDSSANNSVPSAPPQNTVRMLAKDGKYYYIPHERVSDILADGGKVA